MQNWKWHLDSSPRLLQQRKTANSAFSEWLVGAVTQIEASPERLANPSYRVAQGLPLATTAYEKWKKVFGNIKLDVQLDICFLQLAFHKFWGGSWHTHTRGHSSNELILWENSHVFLAGWVI